MGGMPVRLIDTAGLREAENEAEQIGVRRAKEEMEQADVVLLVLDGSSPIAREDEALLMQTKRMRRCIVANKTDLGRKIFLREPYLPVSARTGEGLAELREQILDMTAPVRPEETVITNERHLFALERARESVEAAILQEELELKATDIRACLLSLGEITGSSVDDLVIERIFSNFCVGK